MILNILRTGVVAAGVVLFAPSIAFALTLEPIGRYQQPEPGEGEDDPFDEAAAEIASYDPETQLLFVTNSFLAGIDILDLTAPADPTSGSSSACTPASATSACSATR